MHYVAIAKAIFNGSNASQVLRNILIVIEIRVKLCLDEHQRSGIAVVHDNVCNFASIYAAFSE